MKLRQQWAKVDFLFVKNLKLDIFSGMVFTKKNGITIHQKRGVVIPVRLSLVSQKKEKPGSVSRIKRNQHFSQNSQK